MWYRLVLAYREVQEKEGEISFHRTKSDYDRPSFMMDENAQQSSQTISGGGNNYLTQGPGLYTSQNPAEMHHYNFLPKTRQVRIPKGARILDYENLSEEDVQTIINGWNEKYNTNYVYNSSMKDMDDILHLITNSEMPIDKFKMTYRKQKDNIPGNPTVKLYPLLLKLGYDAIDYYDYTGRQNDPTKYLKSPEHQQMSRRTRNKKDKNIDKKNILIINRSMITRPDLFQKARFRPETLTEEDKKIIDDENQTTNVEYGKDILEAGALPNATEESVIEFLEAGVDPLKVLPVIRKIDFWADDISGKDRFDFLRKIKKYYNENIIFVLFTSAEIEDHKKEIRAILGDYGRGEAVGFAINAREGIEKYLKRLNNKYFLYGYIDENLGIEETVSAIKQWQKLTEVAKLDKSLSKEVPFRTGQLFDHFKQLIKQEKSFDLIYRLVNDIELKKFLPRSVIQELVWKQNELRMQNGVDLLAQRNEQTEKEMEVERQKFLQSQQPAQQPAQKVAYKILQKTAGKTKYYYFNGESKPLRDHLEDIFPYANSVDIFYMMGRLRNKAMSDDQVANLLYEAAMGRLFPRFEDKRA